MDFPKKGIRADPTPTSGSCLVKVLIAVQLHSLGRRTGIDASPAQRWSCKEGWAEREDRFHGVRSSGWRCVASYAEQSTS